MESRVRKRLRLYSFVRIVTISTVLCLLLTQTGNPQRVSQLPGIGLALRCPTYIVAACQSMTLQADVYGAKEVLGDERAKLLAYKWEITGGMIINGQGTPNVAIEASDRPLGSVGLIDVKIRIEGGPPEMNRERSCTLRIDPKCARPSLFDQYADISLKDEQERLDRLGKRLISEGSGSVVYAIAYAGQRSCLWEAEWRANRAKKYLVDNYKVDASRVIAVDGGFRDKLTVDLFLSPRDSCGPFPSPTLMGSAADINGSCTDKYKETDTR